ncbi:hypothetical protein GCM10023156_53480 [Novipirellula rosea]|uniref:Uncharacterized protein n=1 Tax=Novipirellula rosea TaxID=1031540 RepID=A0ABP8NHS9_9BACT
MDGVVGDTDFGAFAAASDPPESSAGEGGVGSVVSLGLLGFAFIDTILLRMRNVSIRTSPNDLLDLSLNYVWQS